MNYNEYDSNGNKKKFNLIDIINDKQKRSRAILLIYLVFFILLIIMVRFSLKSSLNNEANNNSVVDNNEIVTNNNQENIEKPNDNNDDELNEMFSDIDTNNYEFKYVVDIKDSVSTIVGKRYDDKFSFTLENSGSIIYFNGTSNYIKAKESEDGEYKLNGFPFVLVNYFDSNIIKKMINNSNLNNGKFEISNETIGNLANKDLSNKEAINTMEVYLKNNKIYKIELDFSNAVSTIMDESVNAKISLEYFNFGLIDNFEIE